MADGHIHEITCHGCLDSAAYQRCQRRLHPDRHRQYQRDFKKRHADRLRDEAEVPTTRMRTRAFSTITRSKRDGIEYDRDYLFEVAANPPELCPVCGQPIDYSVGKGNKPLSNGPSFDRWDNSKGYIRGNVNIICRRCNTLKGNMTPQDIENLRNYMGARQ